MLSPERSDMPDRLISDLVAYIAHLSYAQIKKKVALYRPVIAVEGQHAAHEGQHGQSVPC